MNHHYEDIRGLVPYPPVWFDEHAVPRYCAFSPDATANIYCDEACLVLITCQGCGTKFNVCFSSNSRGTRLSQRIDEGSLHYGDPPNIGCCPAGPTMNSEPRRVLEYWHRPRFEWERNSAFEVDIEPPWVK